MIFDIYSALIHPVAVSGRQCEPVVLRQKVSQIRKAGGRRFRNGGGGGRLRFPAEFEVGPVLIHPVVVSDCNSLLRNVMGPVRPGRAEINACRCRCGKSVMPLPCGGIWTAIQEEIWAGKRPAAPAARRAAVRNAVVQRFLIGARSKKFIVLPAGWPAG